MAPAGTLVLIWVEEIAVNVAGVQLKETAVALVKLIPVMMTGVPSDPLVGENELIRGRALFSLKLVELVTLPAVLVTLMGPLVAPAGTMVSSTVSEIPSKGAAVVPL